MATIEIEGSLTPASDLPRGERRKVQDSAAVRKFVADGYAVVVGEDGEPEPAPLPDAPTAPARNGSTDAWRDFLTGQGVEFDPDATRDELVDLWEKRTD